MTDRERRIFLDAELTVGATVSLDTHAIHHLRTVLRIQDGATVVLCNNKDGYDYAGTVTASVSTVSITARRQNNAELPYRLIMFCALLKGDKTALIIQKGTELGVTAFIPLLTERSVVRTMRDTTYRRLIQIAHAAAAQCGRAYIPDIAQPHTIENAVMHEASREMRSRFLCTQTGVSIRGRAVQGDCVVAVGPEGGFSTAEHTVLCTHGFEPVSFGTRTLRAETAAIAAPAVITCLHECTPFPK